MKIPKTIAFYYMLVLCSMLLLGCRKKADENKPISEVKAEAGQMTVDELKAMALKYKKAIVTKNMRMIEIICLSQLVDSQA